MKSLHKCDELPMNTICSVKVRFTEEVGYQ